MIISVKKLYPDASVPERTTNGAIGFDVHAYHILDPETQKPIDQHPLPFTLEPGQSVLIGTGIKFAIPWAHQCEVRPRSGLAAKHRVTLANSPGTIDPDFRGEVGILLCNEGQASFIVNRNMRIAQLIFSQVLIPTLEIVEELPNTIRDNGGFGSTGLMGISEGTGEFERQVREQDRMWMQLAIAASLRSGCVRDCVRGSDGQFLRDNRGSLVNQTHRFGCVVVVDDAAISTGFNGPAPGQPPCTSFGCLRAEEKIVSGTQIERGRCIHAEWMAITNLAKRGGGALAGATMYVTAEPCLICAKMIASLGINALVVLEGNYLNNGIKIVKAAGVIVRIVKKSDL